jgi:hypothetical protein
LRGEVQHRPGFVIALKAELGPVAHSHLLSQDFAFCA